MMIRLLDRTTCCSVSCKPRCNCMDPSIATAGCHWFALMRLQAVQPPRGKGTLLGQVTFSEALMHALPVMTSDSRERWKRHRDSRMPASQKLPLSQTLMAALALMRFVCKPSVEIAQSSSNARSHAALLLQALKALVQTRRQHSGSSHMPCCFKVPSQILRQRCIRLLTTTPQLSAPLTSDLLSNIQTAAVRAIYSTRPLRRPKHQLGCRRHLISDQGVLRGVEGTKATSLCGSGTDMELSQAIPSGCAKRLHQRAK